MTDVRIGAFAALLFVAGCGLAGCQTRSLAREDRLARVRVGQSTAALIAAIGERELWQYNVSYRGGEIGEDPVL